VETIENRNTLLLFIVQFAGFSCQFFVGAIFTVTLTTLQAILRENGSFVTSITAITDLAQRSFAFLFQIHLTTT
jgi:hypothetical protein